MASNYTSSAIVDFFHELPHYDFAFKPVSKDFRYSDADYQQALAQFAIPWVLFMVLFVVLLICAGRKKRFSDYTPIDDRGPQAIKNWLTCLLVGSILIVLMCPVQYYANEEITIGIRRFSDRLNDAQLQYDSVLATAASTNASVQSVVSEINRLAWPDENQKDQIIDSLVLASESLDAINGFGDAFDVGSYGDDVIKYDEIRWIAMMGFAAVLVSTAFMAYIGRKHMQKVFCILDAIIASLALMIAGVYLSAIVGFADFCSDPNTVIGDLLPDYGLPAQAASYYINCPLGESSPLVEDVDSALGFLNSTLQEVQRQCSLNASICGVAATLDEVNSNTIALSEATGCAALHADYVGSLQAVCGPTLEGFLAVLVAVTVSALAIFSVAFSLIRLKFYINESSNPMTKESQVHKRKRQRGRRRQPGEYDPLVSETYFGPA